MNIEATEKIKERSFKVEHIDILKTITEVGERICFIKRGVQDGKIVVTRTIEGIVLEKFPWTFRLSDGHTYTWSEYMLGCSTEMKSHVFALEKLCGSNTGELNGLLI